VSGLGRLDVERGAEVPDLVTGLVALANLYVVDHERITLTFQ
jgi:hypothetical protein